MWRVTTAHASTLPRLPGAGALIVGLLLLLAFISPARAQDAPPEPPGYRLEDYRARTPKTLRGATVLDDAGAFELWSRKTAVFIDALPRPPRPEGIPKTAVWRDKPRFNIPGGVWLPDVGYGDLAAPMRRYFETGLSRATAGDKAKPLVFYCLENCWMSWNAAKRALEFGYSRVYWYPRGTDGWEKAGHPLEEAHPLPRE